MLSHRKSLKHLLAPISLSLCLASCSGLDFGLSSKNSPLWQDVNASSDYYLRHSQQATSLEERNNFKLLAARALLQENKLAQAQGLLSELTQLTRIQEEDKTLILAHLSALSQQNHLAQQALQQLNFNDLNSTQKIRFLAISAQIEQNKGDYLSALNQRLAMDDYFTSIQEKQRNNDEIWAILRQMPASLLQNSQFYADNNPRLQGWLSLANLYNQHIDSLETLRSAILNWKVQHAQHSAVYLLPKELQNIFNFQHLNVGRVALLLPLSGNVKLIGNTVKQGFEFAHANSYEPVSVFDTSSGNMAEILQQVKAQGITTVIGPLLKQNVQQLIQNPQWLTGLNVLALNTPSQAPSLGQMCYFSLAPEDEARSAADKMWQQHIQLPLVLVPKNNLGQRVANAFTQHWQALGGNEIQVDYYTDMADLRPIFVRAIGIIEPSEKDKGKANYREKNRRDFDPTFQAVQAVFALGDNLQLADIKTTIDNTNVKLPLFASSRINSPNNQGSYRLLMEGTKFTDLPLFKDPTSDDFLKIARANQEDYSLMRLYAMGADAWKVVNNLNEMRHIAGFHVSGLTGNLSANYRCEIQRDMTWFEFKQGRLIEENALMLNNETPSQHDEPETNQEDVASLL